MDALQLSFSLHCTTNNSRAVGQSGCRAVSQEHSNELMTRSANRLHLKTPLLGSFKIWLGGMGGSLLGGSQRLKRNYASGSSCAVCPQLTWLPGLFALMRVQLLSLPQFVASTSIPCHSIAWQPSKRQTANGKCRYMWALSMILLSGFSKFIPITRLIGVSVLRRLTNIAAQPSVSQMSATRINSWQLPFDGIFSNSTQVQSLTPVSYTYIYTFILFVKYMCVYLYVYTHIYGKSQSGKSWSFQSSFSFYKLIEPL